MYISVEPLCITFDAGIYHKFLIITPFDPSIELINNDRGLLMIIVQPEPSIFLMRIFLSDYISDFPVPVGINLVASSQGSTGFARLGNSLKPRQYLTNTVLYCTTNLYSSLRSGTHGSHASAGASPRWLGLSMGPNSMKLLSFFIIQ